jgi:hypothetical protein
MNVICIESIDYHILCDHRAIIQSSNNSIAALLPRNCVTFNGSQISVTHLLASALRGVVKPILIPYSLQTISGFYPPALRGLEYLVFECGSPVPCFLPHG